MTDCTLTELHQRVEGVSIAQAKLSATLEGLEKVITKHENLVDKRFDSVNEFRATLSDQATRFVTRAEHTSMLNGYTRDLMLCLSRLERMESLTLSADKAIIKAETAADKRFESVNEFRAQLSDQTRSFVTRNEVNAIVDGMSRDTSAALSRLDKLEGKSGGIGYFATAVAGVLGLLIAATAIVVSFLRVD